MALFQAFRAVRPAEGKAEKVAALPYDVVSREEAREIGEKNPYSFLHVDRAEMDLDPGIEKSIGKQRKTWIVFRQREL